MRLTNVGGLGSGSICLTTEVDYGVQGIMPTCEVLSHVMWRTWRAMLGTLSSDAHHQGLRHCLLRY